MSFPAATLMISNLVAKEHQGMAASLVATVVYYSQLIGLGIAGTVEVYVRDGNLFKGLMAALYSAVALSGVGLLVAFGYVAYGSAHLHHFLGRSKGNVQWATVTSAPRSPMPCGAGTAVANGTPKNTSNSWAMRCRVVTRD